MADYLAFDLGMHVLAILTDMTNYCVEHVRKISAAREEVPGRKGYPGYLSADCTLIITAEEQEELKVRDGSVTQVPILSMPADDISASIQLLI